MSDAAVVFAPASPLGLRINPGATLNGTFPTIAEINASYSHFNQVVALYNRRASQIYASPTAFGYIDPSVGKIPAATINSLRTAINALRADMSLSAFAFGVPVVANATKIATQHLVDLRSAITLFSSVAAIPAAFAWLHTRNDNPWGTQVSDTNAASPSFPNVGQDGSSAPYPRRRLGCSYLLRANFNASLTASVRAFVVTHGSGALQLHASNSDDHSGPANWWLNLDTFCATSTGTVGARVLAVPTAQVTGLAGLYRSFVLTHLTEVAGTLAPGDYDTLSSATLQLDFGF